MQRFQSVKHTAVRFATVLLIASLAFFTGCNSEGSNEGSPGFSQNPGVGVPPGTATMLDITGVPANVVANQPFNVTVRVEDANGNLVTNEPTRITLTLMDITPRGMLFGQKTMDSVDGIATFTVSIDGADMFTITASAPGMMSDTSGTITVAPGDPTLIFANDPSTTADLFSPMATPLIAMITDSSGNPVSYNGPANVVVLSGPGPLTNASVNVMNAIADFSTLGFSVPGDYQLQLQIPGFPAATFNFDVTVAADAIFVIQDGRLQTLDDNNSTAEVEVVDVRPNDIGNGTYLGLAISPAGQFFTVDTTTNQLVEIDPLTGAGTPVGAGIGNAGTITDIAWAGPNTIVALENQGNDPFVFTINANTGVGSASTQLQQMVDDGMGGMMLQNITDRINNAITRQGGTQLAYLNALMPSAMSPNQFGTLVGNLFTEGGTLAGNQQVLHLADHPTDVIDDLLSIVLIDGDFRLFQVDESVGTLLLVGEFTGIPTGIDSIDGD